MPRCFGVTAFVFRANSVLALVLCSVVFCCGDLVQHSRVISVSNVFLSSCRWRTGSLSRIRVLSRCTMTRVVCTRPF